MTMAGYTNRVGRDAAPAVSTAYAVMASLYDLTAGAVLQFQRLHLVFQVELQLL